MQLPDVKIDTTSTKDWMLSGQFTTGARSNVGPAPAVSQPAQGPPWGLIVGGLAVVVASAAAVAALRR